MDCITVAEHLKSAGELDGVGGLAYLSGLEDATPSPANLPYWLGILSEKLTLRDLLAAAAETTRECWECPAGESDGVLSAAEQRVLAIRMGAGISADVSMKDSCREAIAEIESEFNGVKAGLPTPYDGMNKAIGGFFPSTMTVIAARPSCGKTALAVNLATWIASAGHPVGIFSLEMTRKALTRRMISSAARINTRTPRSLTVEEFRPLTSAAGTVGRLPIYIEDSGDLTVSGIRAKARRWKQKFKIELLIIDYLQLIHGRRGTNRREAVDEISRDVKTMAKELELPVIILAQLNRDIDKDPDRKPRLSDLRESGQIEQDADLIGFLYRTEEDSDAKTYPVNLLIAKQREGPRGVDIHFHFHSEFTLFEEISRMSPV